MFDRLGIICSVVCATHCALPVVLSFLSPSIAAYFGNEWVHFSLLFTVIPLALFSFLTTKKTHGKNTPLLTGAVGIFFLIFAILGEPYFDNAIEHFELTFTILGSLVLISGHFLNLQLMSKPTLTKVSS